MSACFRTLPHDVLGNLVIECAVFFLLDEGTLKENLRCISTCRPFAEY